MNDWKILNERALELCHKIFTCDDSHDMYSDHEGDKDGPTWHLWSQGHDDFELYCQRAIDDHQRALDLWLQFRELNKERQP